MSQTWNIPIAATDTLSASRPKINDAFEALRTAFSGTSAPSSPVAGQWFLNTSENKLYFYNGTSWIELGDVTTDRFALLPRSGGSSFAMTGDLYMGSHQIKGLAAPTHAGDAVALSYLQANYLPLSGGTMTGDITMGANNVLIDHDPTADEQAARKAYVDSKVAKAGDSMSGNLDMGGNLVTNLGTPANAGDATSKSYVDGKFDVTAGHDHDGTDSKRVEGAYLASSGRTKWETIYADGSDGAMWNVPCATVFQAFTGGDTWNTLTTTQTTVQSLTISNINSELRLLLFATAEVSMSTYGAVTCYATLRTDSGDLLPNVEVDYVNRPGTSGTAADRTSFCLVYMDVAPGSGSVTYYLDLWVSSGAEAAQYRRPAIRALVVKP